MKYEEFDFYYDELSVRKLVEDNIEYFEGKDIPEEKQEELLLKSMNLIYEKYDSNKNNLVSILWDFYRSILFAKYYKDLNDGVLEDSCIDIFMSSYLRLKYSDLYNIIKFEDQEYIKNICKIAYDKVRHISIKTHSLSENPDEELKLEHIFDLRYYLDSFENWYTGNEKGLNKINKYRELLKVWF